MIKSLREHMEKFSGRVVFTNEDWNLIYDGSDHGTHQFFAEKISYRVPLGVISFEEAKNKLEELKQEQP